MIKAFYLWFSKNHSLLTGDGLSIKLSPMSVGLPKNGISAVLRAGRAEVTIELWETGESEFYFLDWDAVDHDPQAGIVVTHYDFIRVEELYAALDQLVSRMSPVPA